MGRKSTIETLPEDIRAELDRLMLDPRMTQLKITAQINDLLAEQGSDDRVSKSSIGRYAISFEELTAEAVETERLSVLMLKELKIDNQSAIGQTTAEMLRVILFRILPVLKNAMSSGELDLKEMQAVMGMINTATSSHERIERSATINENRKRDMERDAEIKANKKAAETMVKSAKKAGLSDEDCARMRADFLGIEVAES